MIYHVITTPECNLCCEYCCGKSFSEPESKLVFETVPTTPQYSQKELADFLKKDLDKPVSLIFYGGEPLLNIDFIKQTIDYQKQQNTVENFFLQTNGMLLDELPKEYVNSFHTILVSIDGNQKTTNTNRGLGTYEKIVSNLKKISSNDFNGELIARMTIEEPTNFFDDISFLLNNKDFSFSSIHWQLDANMWHDYKKRDFSNWIKQYNSDITRLVDYWLSEMRKGRVLRLYPFMGIMNSLLFKKNYFLRCGSGIGNFTILPNGKISACPIMSGVREYYLGDLNSDPKNLPFKLKIKEPCVSCEEYALCGGRCLYSNLNPVWPKKGINEICDSVKYLINELKRIEPEIQELLDKKIISKKDFDFLKYNCCEIIP
ncbi:MAG: TIGR04084 family radical SAM/SPASM domain-containing protein [Candidatus ainarchaeum sp.]|nr:TIGR04084 family radical SAM/SPASM domain-containing protein [Candidatus ainarchaeum sp.]